MDWSFAALRIKTVRLHGSGRRYVQKNHLQHKASGKEWIHVRLRSSLPYFAASVVLDLDLFSFRLLLLFLCVYLVISQVPGRWTLSFSLTPSHILLPFICCLSTSLCSLLYVCPERERIFSFTNGKTRSTRGLLSFTAFLYALFLFWLYCSGTDQQFEPGYYDCNSLRACLLWEMTFNLLMLSGYFHECYSG